MAWGCVVRSRMQLDSRVDRAGREAWQVRVHMALRARLPGPYRPSRPSHVRGGTIATGRDPGVE